MIKQNTKNQNARKRVNLFSKWVGEGLNKAYSPKEKSRASFAFLGLIVLSVLLTSGTRLYNYEHYIHANNFFLPDRFGYQLSMFLMYGALSLCAVGCAYVVSKKQRKKLMLGATLAGMGISAVVTLALFFGIDFLTLAFYAHQAHIGISAFSSMFKGYFVEYGVLYLIPALLVIISFGIKGYYLRRQDQTSGEQGTAAYADKQDLMEMGAYVKTDEEGVIFGKDDKGTFLRHPICNRTIISQTGGGKTAGVVIPTLLTQNRPMFIHDLKGELWAVTARHRHDVFGHEIALIDPYGITKEKEFQAGKSIYLKNKVYRFNPLDAIPADPAKRDEAIGALVKSLITKGDSNSQKDNHFAGMAEILLMGLIDWVLLENEKPTLMMVHDLLTVKRDKIEETLTSMSKSTSMRAKAAGAQVLGAAREERGSILTTTYLQLSWLADVSLRDFVSESTFDLQDLIKGKMDVYVTMPGGQTRERSRVFRMLLASVRNLMVQSPKSQFSKETILFLFDELGQLGYCEDIVNMIPIMRAYNGAFWAIFQDISQIKLYGEMKGMFTSAKLMQFFGITDTETIRWICELGGRKTYVSTSTSESKGQSGAKASNSSRNESISVQESGADLIKANEVREMPNHKQLVFIQGQRPIECEKVFYFKERFFDGKYDPNPLKTD